MSLKAKLEAVIYAAEEPVTLSQLAGLFAVEALEYKSQREEAARAATQAEQNPEPLPMLDQSLEYLGLEQTPELYTSSQIHPVEAATLAAEPAPDQTEPEQSAAAPVPAEADDPESEAKRQARQRDRDVKGVLRQLLDELIDQYGDDSRGVEIREVAGGYRMATKPECHDAVRLFIKSLKPPLKLSLPALETLAVIAYKQPVTAPEVNEIRGVDSAGVFGSLLSRKLITTAGRKQVIGRPILYKTTKEFLLRFGLKDLAELPSMEEFEKMAASELIEAAESAETESGFEPVPHAGPELDENSPDDDQLETAAGEQPDSAAQAESMNQEAASAQEPASKDQDRHD